MKRFFAVLFLGILFCFGCGGGQSIRQPTNAMPKSNISEVPPSAVPQPVPPAVNINRPIEEKRELGKQLGRGTFSSKLDVGGVLQKNDYKVIYNSDEDNKVLVVIAIGTQESEVKSIDLTFPKSNQLLRLTNPIKNSYYRKDKNRWVPATDPSVKKCFAGAKSLVDKYETDLSVPPEQRNRLFLDHCSDMPDIWVTPLKNSQSNVDLDEDQ